MKKIAFICTGNCCRSQMAEAFGHKYVKESKKDIEVYSAGSFPAGFVHPMAMMVMKEKDIDIVTYRSKSLKDIPFNELNYAITLCDLAQQVCPTAPRGKMIHWSLPDPSGTIGSKETKMNAFRKSRDDIERRVKEFIKSV